MSMTDVSLQYESGYDVREGLIAVLAAVVIDDIPQTGGIPTAVAAEEHRVVGRGRAAARRQAGHKGVHWFTFLYTAQADSSGQ